MTQRSCLLWHSMIIRVARDDIPPMAIDASVITSLSWAITRDYTNRMFANKCKCNVYLR